MTQWEQRVQSHPAVAAIIRAKDVASALEGVPTELAEIADRVAYALMYVAALVERCDPRLLTQVMLDAPLNSAQALEGELQAFQTDHDPEHLTRANAALEQILDVVRAWPGFITSSDETAAARDILGQMEQVLADVIERQRQTLEGLTADAARLREELQSTKGSADDAATTWSKEIEDARAAFGQRVAETTSTIDTQKARLDQAIAEFQSQFSAAQEERRKAADEVRAAQTEQFDTYMKQLATESRTEIENRRTTAEEVLAEVKSLRDQAAKATEAIGIAGMAEGFRKDADEQKNAADWLRNGAIAALVMTATLAAWAAATTHSGHFQLTQFGAPSLCQPPLVLSPPT